MRKEDVHSLCAECLRIGWVTEEDYADDVEVSEMWPQWCRDFYYSQVGAGVEFAQKNLFWRYSLCPAAFFYIHAANGIQEKNYKLLAWIPFLPLFGLTGLLILGLKVYK